MNVITHRGDVGDDLGAIRNSDGLWINTNVFREAALHHKKYGYYTADPVGTPDWVAFWEEELRRCKEGYSVGGARITGDHYFYLNYCKIQLTELSNVRGKGADKSSTFPNFWDYDFNFFHTLEIAKYGTTPEDLAALHLECKPIFLDGGKHMIVFKTRRRGYSYKNAAICVNRYNTIRKSVTLICSFMKEYLYPEGTMGMANDYIDLINKHTGWTKKMDYVEKAHHKEASYKEEINGVDVKMGYRSSIRAISFKDNPGAARGKDGTLILFEEAGKFPNLEESYLATKPALEDGIYTTGQMIVFGTSSLDEKENADLIKMFYNPEPYDLLPFQNIWDKEAGQGATCGLFVPDNFNKIGFIDDQGNSLKDEAKQWNLDKRKEIEQTSSSSDTLLGFIVEYPLEPQEGAFFGAKNDFPIEQLRRQINRVRANKLMLRKGQPVTLVKEGGEVKAIPDLSGEIKIIDHYPAKQKDLTGGVLIWEWPVENAPKGLYKIGFDPYRQHKSTTESLACAYVYKSANDFSFTGDTLVAEYVGRPETYDQVYQIIQYLAEYYNAEIMYENEVTSVADFFTRNKKLNLLALQPDHVISAAVKKPSVSRVYGVHMNERMKDAGEKYIKEWLLRERNFDAEGKPILNLETIYSIPLLQELIAYNPQDRKVNTDRVMALMCVMFAERQEVEGKIYQKSTSNERLNELAELVKTKYRRAR